MQMAMAAVITIGLVGMFSLIALTVMLYATRYKIAPADEILVMSVLFRWKNCIDYSRWWKISPAFGARIPIP